MDRIRIALLGPAVDLQGETSQGQGRVRISSAMEKQGYALLSEGNAPNRQALRRHSLAPRGTAEKRIGIALRRSATALLRIE